MRTLVILFFSLALLIPGFVHAGSWATIDSPTTQTLYALDVSGDLLVASGNEGSVIKSEDGGLSWEYLYVGTNIDLFDIEILGDKEYIAVGEDGTIIRTTDEGEDWNEVSISGLSNADSSKDFNAIVFSTASIGYVVGDAGVMLKTTNGGDSWDAIDSPTTSNINNVATRPSSAHVWLAADNGELYRSRDRGESWEDQTTSITHNMTTVRFTDNSDGWAVGENKTFLRTTNGGADWDVVSISEVDSDEDYFDVSFANSSRGILSTNNARMMQSTDGGKSWDPTDSQGTIFLRDLYAVSTTVWYGVGNNGVIARFDDIPPSEPSDLEVEDTSSSTPRFSWDEAFDDESQISHYMFSIDDETPYSVGNTTEYVPEDPIPNGDHTLDLYAVDAGGNEGDTVSISFTVDADSTSTAGPEVGDISPSTAVKDEDVTFFSRISSSVPFESCDLYVDDEFETSMTLKQDVAFATLRFDTNGEYDVYARCTDENGESMSSDEIELDVSSGSSHAQPGDLIKLGCEGDIYVNDPCTTVYYYGSDGQRHAFPNERVFKNWFDDFDNLVILSSSAMSAIPLGRNVVHRPGDRMVKFTTKTVYAVSYNAILRPIATAQIAESIFGSGWESKIESVSDVFYSNYRFGSSIEGTNDFDIDDIITITDTIDKTF